MTTIRPNTLTSKIVQPKHLISTVMLASHVLLKLLTSICDMMFAKVAQPQQLTMIKLRIV